MVKYNVNLKFNENGKSLNEIISNVLKIELEKRTYMTYNTLNKKASLESTYYSKNKRSFN